MTIFFVAVLIAAAPVQAKDKNKQVLPDYVLKAQTVFVAIYPDAGEPVTNPTANRTAQENVENALTRWGRFRLVMDSQTADLIIAVRKGSAGGPTISNSPIDNRPVIIQPGDGNIRVGGHQGRPPDLNEPGLGPSPPNGPRLGSEIGMSEDMFAVYRGGMEYPLDGPSVWRYTAKGALNGPRVPAVDQFQKVIIEAEKQHAHQP
jgi:hypothetical protein